MGKVIFKHSHFFITIVSLNDIAYIISSCDDRSVYRIYSEYFTDLSGY